MNEAANLRSQPRETAGDDQIGGARLYVYSAACAAAVASGYYIHPVIARVGEDFGVSGGLLGLVPALNQIGLALGILLLLPLGDRVSNRNLVTLCATGQLLALAAMAVVTDFALFLAASFVLGFLTITPYLLPAYVTRRVRPGQLGFVTGIMSAGVTVGILGARTGGGVMGYYFGWHSAYILGAALMLVLIVALRRAMPVEPPAPRGGMSQGGYFHLLKSLGPIIRDTPHLIRAGLIQALGFGGFLVLWLGLAFHLVSPEMGYDVDTVGLLGLTGAIHIWSSPLAGKWVDRVGPLPARRHFAVAKLLGSITLLYAAYNIWWLIPAVVLFGLGGASVDVANRTRLFQLAPEIRTRLMTVYIVIMFIGGGLCSWLGTIAWEAGGWPAVAWLTIGLCAALFLLTLGGKPREAGSVA